MRHINNYSNGFFSNWDYLIILDACRHDIFKQVVEDLEIPGKLTEANTRSGNTQMWYRRFWSYHDHDVILLSANPQPFSEWSWYASRRFKEAIWADPEGLYCRENENLLARIEPLLGTDGFGTFHPQIVLDCFEEIKQSGDKYLIHLMPPHLPFIGEKGKELFEDLGLELYGHRNIYRAVQEYGEWEYLGECYKESLTETLKYLLSRIDLFGGKVVISSDHGEFIGENSWYTHKHCTKYPKLFELIGTVPWFELERRIESADLSN